MNSFGQRLRIQILGESHGRGVGIVLDGVPPGLPIDEDAMQRRMDERRPGRPLTSQRNESDRVDILAGSFEGKSTGAPLMLWVGNEDARSQDYDALRRFPRPGHSDWIAGVWARGANDPRGGGHYSGRLTAGLVAAAAVIAPLLAQHGVGVGAHLDQVGTVGPGPAPLPVKDLQRAGESPVATAHAGLEDAFVAAIDEARRAGDSVGGVVAWAAEGVPRALGDPFFDSVESRLAHLLFAVPAVKGVDFGAGMAAAGMRGSQHNDPFTVQDGDVRTASNHAGGVLGGRTTGMPLWGRVAIKPASSIFVPQPTVDTRTNEPASLELKGRHDPCIAVRAVPVVRACVELVLADFLLLGRQEGHVEVPQ